MTTQTVRLDTLLTPLGQGSPKLAQWFRKLKNDPANAKMANAGDSTSNSTTGPSRALLARLAGISLQSAPIPKLIHTAPGEGLAGMTPDTAHFIDCGNSGMTLAVWLADYDAGVTTEKSLRWLIAQAPDLINLSWGVNGTRTGQVTKAQLVAQLTRAITILRRALPNSDIVLRIPATFLTTNYNGLNYVQDAQGNVNPAGLAQAYSDLLRSAYYALQDRWPNVVLADAQTAVFGTIAQAYTASGYMSDQLHPAQAGQYALMDWLVSTVIGHYPTRVQTSAASFQVKALAPYAPWTLDPAALDDTSSFALLATTPYSNQGAGYLDITLAPAGIVTNFDLLRLPDGQVVQLPGSGVTISQNGPTTRIQWSSMPTSAVTSGQVRVYRQIVTGDSAVNTVLADPSWRFKRVGRVISGSSTGLTIRAASATPIRVTQPAAEWPLAAGNSIYVEGAGATPITLAGGQFAVAANDMTISGQSGVDYSTLVGRLVVVVGTQADGQKGDTGAQGPAGGVGSPLISGRFSITAVLGSTTTSAGGTLGTDYAIPFVPLNSGSIDQLLADVPTAVAGATFRLGLRSSTGFLPDALVADGGVIDASTVGAKPSVAISAALTGGQLYWLTLWLTGTAAANLRIVNGISPLVTVRGVASELYAAYSCARGTTDGALPSAWGTNYTPASWAPLLRARAV